LVRYREGMQDPDGRTEEEEVPLSAKGVRSTLSLTARSDSIHYPAQVVSAIITDPAGTNQAHVDAGGNLHVAGGVTIVGGTIEARTALAMNHLQETTFLVPGLQDQATLFGPADIGEKVAISSLTFTNFGTKVGVLEIDVITNIGAPPNYDATGGVGHNTLQQISVPIGDSVQFTYPEPLVATASEPWCLVADRIFGDDIRLTMVGFKA
jgi:hypothetical protein